MSLPTVLMVEDDLALRKLFQLVLSTDGYEVWLAGSVAEGRDLLRQRGLPEVVLLDLMLPDEDAFEVVQAVRSGPGGQGVPILAVSGSLTRLQEARASSAGFSEFLIKPVDLPSLRDAVRRHAPLTVSDEPTPRPGEGRRVLVVDDNPVLAKVTRLRLVELGFEVELAADGLEALERLQEGTWDAVVSDVIMPRMDGLQLCHTLRQDSRFCQLPVLLASGAFVEDPDMMLARSVGANDVVFRTPDLRSVANALLKCLDQPAPDVPVVAPAPEEYVPRLFGQLERQVLLNHGLTQRCSQLGTSLSLLASLSGSLCRSPDVKAGAAAMLEQLVVDGRFKLAAIQLLDEGESTWLQRPLDIPLTLPAGSVQRCLGEREPIAVHGVPGIHRLILCPLLQDDRPIGILAVGENGDADSPEHSLSFARVLGLQLGQGLAMARLVAVLSETQARFEQMGEHVQEVLALYKADLSQVLYVSPAFERIWGRPLQSLYQDPMSFLHQVHTEDRNAVVQTISAVQGGVGGQLQFRIQRADGKVRFLMMYLTPIRDEEGAVYRICSVCQDVTERRLLEEQLLHAQKMEAIGRLAGGVAHDFNNLLTVITGYGDIARSEVRADDPLAEYLDQILRAAQRASLLTRQLLTFSRQSITRLAIVDVNATLVDMERMLKRVIGEDLVLELSPCQEPALVRVDAGQLEQAVMNLAVNSRDAMPEGGTLRFETSLCRVGAGQELAPGRYVRLTVRDTGIGMDEATRRRVFEPFFTTKGHGGTGLGLATTYGIVHSAQGTIKVDSEPGVGTTMELLLPLYEGSLELLAEPTLDARGGTETILLVEDDEAVRSVARAVLTRYGYDVLEARHGNEALRLCERHEGALHLLVTDVVLGQMSGPELALLAAPLRPDMRVLFISGYADDAVLRHGVTERGLAYLEKPFAPEVLARRVRELLDRP